MKILGAGAGATIKDPFDRGRNGRRVKTAHTPGSLDTIFDGLYAIEDAVKILYERISIRDVIEPLCRIRQCDSLIPYDV